jgi:hypothetical protein
MVKSAENSPIAPVGRLKLETVPSPFTTEAFTVAPGTGDAMPLRASVPLVGCPQISHCDQ